MNQRYLATATAMALLIGTGGAFAQAGGDKLAPGGLQGGAPGQERSAPATPGKGRDAGTPQTQSPGARDVAPGIQGQQTPGTKERQTAPDPQRAQEGRPDDKTGQATERERDSRGDTTDQTQEQRQERDRDQARERDGDQDRTRAQETQREGERVRLSSEQRSRIRDVTVERRTELRSVTNVDFEINIGATVPRTVELQPLPTYIVEVVPAYRGYLYILVGSQLLIVHPATYEIVTVIVV